MDSPANRLLGAGRIKRLRRLLWLDDARGDQPRFTRSRMLALILVRLPTSATLLSAAVRMFFTIMRYFMAGQFAMKLGVIKAPLVGVDHPLDRRIRFRPELAPIYFDFIGFWVRALAYVLDRTGRKAYPDAARFLLSIGDCYKEAYGVYGRCVSTTRRPSKPANASFVVIHLFDPHLFCLPSLHVMVVATAWLGLRDILAKHGLAEREAAAVEAVRKRAIEIADTVVAMKQHSVNCIPAAFYATRALNPAFGRTESRGLLEGMFHWSELEGGREEVLDYIEALEDRFEAEGAARGGDWQGVLVDFLFRYGEERGTRYR